MKGKHLVLFFTYNVSLQTWEQSGVLDREIALYTKYLDRGWRISFVTYGGKEDLALKCKLKDIEILCNRWHLPVSIYSKYLPFLFPVAFSSADLFKTNQLRGAKVALRVAQYWNKPLVIRCGYLWNSVKRLRLETGLSTPRGVNKTLEEEGLVFPQAEGIILTTETMASYVKEKYHIDDKIHVIPNYVQTNLFSPGNSDEVEDQICCVAKFDEQKNLLNLIEALDGIDVKLLLIGSGHQEEEIKHKIQTTDSNVELLGNMSNSEIPTILQRSKAAILVSLVEGNPKALIEAMSCGLPVIASDVPGIREIIAHKENGYLCNTDPQSIKDAILEVMQDSELRQKMGENARLLIEKEYSLKQVFSKEISIMNEVIHRYPYAKAFLKKKLYLALLWKYLILPSLIVFVACYERTKQLFRP